jgi:hypothetical protein
MIIRRSEEMLVNTGLDLFQMDCPQTSFSPLKLNGYKIADAFTFLKKIKRQLQECLEISWSVLTLQGLILMPANLPK